MFLQLERSRIRNFQTIIKCWDDSTYAIRTKQPTHNGAIHNR